MKTVLIADSSEDFREAAAQALTQYHVYGCQDGKSALDAIMTFQPDYVVIDPFLPGIDGISVLQWAKKAGIHFQSILVCPIITDYIGQCVAELDIAYVIMKPCNMVSLSARLRELDYVITPVCYQPEELLSALAIGSRLKGYPYLVEGIRRSAVHPRLSVTKELYPSLAQSSNTSPAQVERAIRIAISSGCRAAPDKWRSLFPMMLHLPPSNADFLNWASELLAR